MPSGNEADGAAQGIIFTYYTLLLAGEGVLVRVLPGATWASQFVGDRGPIVFGGRFGGPAVGGDTRWTHNPVFPRRKYGD